MLLVLALIGSMMPVVYGSDEGAKQVSFVETDSSLTAADLALEDKNLPASEENESRLYSSNEMVRVSVVLEGQPVLEKGYATAALLQMQGRRLTERICCLINKQWLPEFHRRLVGIWMSCGI